MALKRNKWLKSAGQALRNAPEWAYNTLPGYVAANTARDVGISLGRGAVNAGEALVGAGDLLTGGAVGRGMRGLGYNPEAARRAMSGWYSDAQQAANRKVEAAEGLADKAETMLRNPNTLANLGVESIPLMLGGSAVGSGLMRAGGQAAARHVGRMSALGEGVVNATGAAGQMTQERIDAGDPWSVPNWGTDAAKALAAGVVGGAVGRAGSGATGAIMRAPDLDAMLMQGASRRLLLPGEVAPRPGVLTAGGVAGGAVSEAVPENFMQTALDQAAGNVSGFGYPRDKKEKKERTR